MGASKDAGAALVADSQMVPNKERRGTQLQARRTRFGVIIILERSTAEGLDKWKYQGPPADCRHCLPFQPDSGMGEGAMANRGEGGGGTSRDCAGDGGGAGCTAVSSHPKAGGGGGRWLMNSEFSC